MGFQDVGLRHFLSNAEVTKAVNCTGGGGGAGVVTKSASSQ